MGCPFSHFLFFQVSVLVDPCSLMAAPLPPCVIYVFTFAKNDNSDGKELSLNDVGGEYMGEAVIKIHCLEGEV